MRFYVVALLVLIFAAQIRADDKIDFDKAVEQAKAVAKAVFDEDYEKVVDVMHPKLIEISGGKEYVLANIKTGMKIQKDQGVKLTSHTIGKPGEPVVDGKTAYIVIPTTLERTTRDSKIITESYLLATSTDNGKTWVFVDGAGMDQKKIRDEVFPKLPDGLKLPAKKPPVVTKAKDKD